MCVYLGGVGKVNRSINVPIPISAGHISSTHLLVEGGADAGEHAGNEVRELVPVGRLVKRLKGDEFRVRASQALHCINLGPIEGKDTTIEAWKQAAACCLEHSIATRHLSTMATDIPG